MDDDDDDPNDEDGDVDDGDGDDDGGGYDCISVADWCDWHDTNQIALTITVNMTMLMMMMMIFCICLIMITLSYSAMTRQQRGDDFAKKREWSNLPIFQSESTCQTKKLNST